MIGAIYGQPDDYRGLVVADLNASDQFISGISGVNWSGAALIGGLTTGALSGELFYNDFVSGTGAFTFTIPNSQTSTCGPYTATTGVYSVVRCKFAPVVYSV